MIKNFTTYTCCRCGWVYMGVSRKFAEDEVKAFHDYFKKLSKKKRQDYYNNIPSDISDYEFCHCGNSHKNFRLSKPGDCPDGCTLSSIIIEE